MANQSSAREICLRKPTANDGYPVHQLIKKNPPLDLNSVYSYHLLSRHFGDTCIVAEFQGEIAGFLSAYIIPNQPDTLFVWQVVVDRAIRGQGVARLMLSALLSRPECAAVRYIEATVNPSNKASRRLFEAYAKDWGSGITEEEFLNESDFGGEAHESEILLRIALKSGDMNIKEAVYAHI